MSIIERLPTFIIGGAPRSGTTFLCHALDKHPDVFMAKPFIPEPKVFLMAHDESKEYYKDRYQFFFSEVTHQKALGEKSSAYLENKEAVRRLHQSLPNTRFLFIVRDPVKRAYSNYLVSRKNGLETLSFEEAIALEGKRIDPFPPEKAYVRPFDYLSRGDYATFAERYVSLFGVHQVKFVIFEEVIANPDKLFKEIQTFIQVDPLPHTQLNPGLINASDKSDPPLDPVFEVTLRKRMQPAVERFAALTGLDVGIWGY